MTTLQPPQPCPTCDRDKREVSYCPWCGRGGPDWKRKKEEEGK